MADIWHVTDWRLPAAIGPVYETLVAARGSAELGAATRDGIAALTSGARRLYLFEVTGSGADALRYYHCEPQIAALLPAYADRYKALDPLSALYDAVPRSGDIAVQRVRPGDIASAGFRRRFFDQPGIVERVSVIQRRRHGWCGMNLSRHASQGPLSDRELDAVAGLARLALPMLARAVAPPGGAASPTLAQLEDRLAARCPALTARERQVSARAAFGLSVEATSLELGMAPTSVLTLRQRAYRRLGAGSARELLWLVAH